jgi:hypothetical protein
MASTIYAAFEEVQDAKAAIGALIRRGVPANDITLACKNLQHQTQATDLNPAQDDYPRTGELGVTELSSAPAEAKRDFNEGIEADDYNANYRGNVDREIHAPTESADENRRGEIDQQFGAMPSAFPDLRATGPGNSTGDPAMGGPGTRSAQIAATANAAANPGIMTDFLWNSLPRDVADHYQHQYDGGKAIVIVRASAAEAEDILREKGAISVERQAYLA